MADEEKKDEAKEETPAEAPKAEEPKEEPKKEVKKEEPKEDETKDVEVPKKFKKLVEEIEQMSVLDLSELVKILEDKFGVSAAAPMTMMAAPGAGDAGADAAEEKSEYNVELTGFGDNKINVIKAVREVTGLGLKEAKDMVDNAPKVIKEGVATADAEEMKKKIEDAGGTAELK